MAQAATARVGSKPVMAPGTSYLQVSETACARKRCFSPAQSFFRVASSASRLWQLKLTASQAILDVTTISLCVVQPACFLLVWRTVLTQTMVRQTHMVMAVRTITARLWHVGSLTTTTLVPMICAASVTQVQPLCHSLI